MVPLIGRDFIRKHTLAIRRQYEQKKGKKITYPIDSIDVCERVLGLETISDTQSILNGIGSGIIGSLFPDGQPSPLGRDKQIWVNMTKTEQFDPTVYNFNFTVIHEGAGHYSCHFLQGINDDGLRKPIYCRIQERYSPLEWQANAIASEFLMPIEKVIWLLGGLKPPATVDIELYKKRFREFFDASRSMMEFHLDNWGYTLLNAICLEGSHGSKNNVDNDLSIGPTVNRLMDKITRKYKVFSTNC